MEEETHTDIERLDPETELLLSKSQTRNKWELFKENVRPLKRGRKVGILNDALKSHNDNHLKKSLLEDQRRLIQDEYNGDDPLQPWLERKFQLLNFMELDSLVEPLGSLFRMAGDAESFKQRGAGEPCNNFIKTHVLVIRKKKST